MTKVLAFWAMDQVRRFECAVLYILRIRIRMKLCMWSITYHPPLPVRVRGIGGSLPWIGKIPGVLYRALCHQAPRGSCNLRLASPGQAALHGVTVGSTGA